MTTPNRKSKDIRIGERYCRERGFVKCGANWYRCYGNGLLQVVTFNGLAERTSNSSYLREPSVALGIRSLYGRIGWIDIPIMGTRRDIIPEIVPILLIPEQELLSIGTSANSVELMFDYGFPLLDKIDTHKKLVDLLEHLDMRESHTIRVNDSNKVIPYLLSGQFEKALACIDAIEQQNLQAYAVNCNTMANYDSKMQRKKMYDQIDPYLFIRKCFDSHNLTDLVEILQSNYQSNVDRLSEMGIPFSASCTGHNELTKLRNIH